MKYYWLLPLTALLLLAGFYFYSREFGMRMPALPAYEGRPLPNREVLEKMGRAKEKNTGNPAQERNVLAEQIALKPEQSDDDIRPTLPLLSERFSFTAPSEKEHVIQAIFSRLQPVVQRSKFWKTSLASSVRGKVIRHQLILTLYDSTNRRSADPVRTLIEPKYLAWVLVDYLGIEGRDGLFKPTMSSTIENLVAYDNQYFLFVKFDSIDEVNGYLDYLAIPIPGEASAQAQILPKGGQWSFLPKIDWQPVSESDYREITEQNDRIVRLTD